MVYRNEFCWNINTIIIKNWFMGRFSSRELFHCMYGLGISLFQWLFSMFCPVLSISGLSRPSNLSMFIYYVVYRNFLHLRSLTCKYLATVENSKSNVVLEDNRENKVVWEINEEFLNVYERKGCFSSKQSPA